MEWSNEMVLTFLDYYGEEPVIRNASHPSHKQRNEVHDACKHIEEKMGSEVSVVQLKKKKYYLMA
jgi:pyruvate kinase